MSRKLVFVFLVLVIAISAIVYFQFKSDNQPENVAYTLISELVEVENEEGIRGGGIYLLKGEDCTVRPGGKLDTLEGVREEPKDSVKIRYLHNRELEVGDCPHGTIFTMNAQDFSVISSEENIAKKTKREIRAVLEREKESSTKSTYQVTSSERVAVLNPEGIETGEYSREDFMGSCSISPGAKVQVIGRVGDDNVPLLRYQIPESDVGPLSCPSGTLFAVEEQEFSSLFQK